jgi:hypothetical protein
MPSLQDELPFLVYKLFNLFKFSSFVHFVWKFCQVIFRLLHMAQLVCSLTFEVLFYSVNILSTRVIKYAELIKFFVLRIRVLLVRIIVKLVTFLERTPILYSFFLVIGRALFKIRRFWIIWVHVWFLRASLVFLRLH